VEHLLPVGEMATTGSHSGQMARDGGLERRRPAQEAHRQMGLWAVRLDRIVSSVLYSLSLLKVHLSSRIAKSGHYRLFLHGIVLPMRTFKRARPFLCHGSQGHHYMPC
jgi:hypothetical protein